MTPRLARRGLIVVVTDARGRPIAGTGLGPWLASAAPASARGRVGIALVTDPEMRRLNRRYRGIDRVTDVLSFPADSRPRPQPDRLLGDLAIAKGVAGRQARREGHPYELELRILALHGLLHLLGYDHQTDHGEMRRLEERLRKRAGLAVGLIDRARVRRAR